MAQPSYPGVYIEEFAPGAPIEGVGTSTAVFLGPTSEGPLNTPTKITSWDAFQQNYGEKPRNAKDYLWYAVRGFFQNNGKVCYIVRVSNAAYDHLSLLDGAKTQPQNTLIIRARLAGDFSATPISATIVDVHALSTQLYQPTANIINASGVTAKVNTADDAAQFRPGDRVVLCQGKKSDSSVQVLRVEQDLLRLNTSLTNNYNGGTVRLADLKSGVDDSFRLADCANAAQKLVPGSVLVLTQGIPPVIDTVIVKNVITERIPTGFTYRVTVTKPIERNFDLTLAVKVESQEFTLTISQLNTDGTTYSQIYENLSMEPSSPRYYAQIVNTDPNGRIVLEAVEPPNTTPAPDNRPSDLPKTPLSGGSSDNPDGLTSTDYVNALIKLETVNDVNLVAAPGITDPVVQTAVKEHCERMKDRFAILESLRGAPPFGSGNGSVEEQVLRLQSPDGYAALYYPWLLVQSDDGKERLLMPPSGYIAGIMARTDNNRGVFKAPAGEEAIVNGALGLDSKGVMSDVDQGLLNLRGINVIRVFSSGGLPILWGARTTSTNSNWQYVNIRRLFIFLEQSIEEGIRWAVFEPNNLQLWQKLKRSISEFLTRVWRDGGLFGKTADEAFYVRIDEALNPDSSRALGRLYIEIGVRPSYPAEFIIIRIGIWQGGADVSEK
jgi:uncharacterized protein